MQSTNIEALTDAARAGSLSGLQDAVLKLGRPPTNYELSDALNAAVFNQRLQVVLELITLGANINGSGSDGTIPLQSAIETLNAALVEKLLELGADPNRVDVFGLTPLHCAVDCEVEEARSRYKDCGLVAPSVQITRLLLDFGADPTIKAPSGESALAWAANLGHDKAVMAMKDRTIVGGNQ